MSHRRVGAACVGEGTASVPEKIAIKPTETKNSFRTARGEGYFRGPGYGNCASLRF